MLYPVPHSRRSLHLNAKRNQYEVGRTPDIERDELPVPTALRREPVFDRMFE